MVAIVTDRFDGDIARRWNMVTNFGKIADPIADKALTGAAFIGLSLLGELPWWVTVVVLVREWGVTAAAVLGDPARRDAGQPRRQAEDRPAGDRTGSLPPSVAVGGVLHWTAVAFMGAAVIVTIVTGIDYVGRALRLRAAAKRPLP